MLLTELQPTSDTLQTGPPGRFGLRVRSQAEDYLVDLPGGKTTIGSSPRCNVRIQRPGVQPLHCLVVCEGDGLTVRRWAADALLNGQPFEDAPLAVGDHLSLGPIDVEVVGEQIAEPTDIRDEANRFAEPATEPAPFSWGNDTIHHTTVWIGENDEEAASAPSEHAEAGFEHEDEPVVETLAEVETLATVVPAEAAREVFRQLQTATAISRTRSRKLLDALRASRDAYRTVSAQVDGLTNTKDELVAEYGALARERTMLREQLATAEQRYAEWDHQSNQWDELRKEWDAARAGWDQQHAEWDHERTEWTRQEGEWEARLAGHVSRIEELEAQLAEASADESEPPQAHAVPFQTSAPSTLPAHERPADVSWPTWESQPETLTAAPAQDWVNETANSAIADPLPPASEKDEFPLEHIASANAETAEAQVPAWEPRGPAEPPAWERHTPAWESEPPSWEEHGPTPGDQTPAWDDRNRQSDHEFPEEPLKPEIDVLTAVAPPVAPSGPAAPTTVAAPIAAQEAGEGELSAAGEKPQSVSYIERFSHMFADEQSAGQARQPATAPPAAVDPVAGKPRNMPVIRSDGSAPAAATRENEESIEDYMAKLMQRVRGDRPYVAGSQALPAAHAPQPGATAGESRPTPADSTTAPTPAGPQPTSATAIAPPEDADQQLPMLSELVRKGPVNERPKNLDALRALANESARHAIGVHASKKHRREAVTKFIVASLAGMTSLWLMMLAPDWRDLQFISACVSLLIAAYWAGQTYGTLGEMHRAGDYDGPDDDFDDLNPPLPIDVERVRR